METPHLWGFFLSAGFDDPQLLSHLRFFCLTSNMGFQISPISLVGWPNSWHDPPVVDQATHYCFRLSLLLDWELPWEVVCALFTWIPSVPAAAYQWTPIQCLRKLEGRRAGKVRAVCLSSWWSHCDTQAVRQSKGYRVWLPVTASQESSGKRLSVFWAEAINPHAMQVLHSTSEHSKGEFKIRNSDLLSVRWHRMVTYNRKYRNQIDHNIPSTGKA